MSSQNTIQRNVTSKDKHKYWDVSTRSKKVSNETRKIVKEARILNLSDPDDNANSELHSNNLPEGARLLASGTSFADFDIESLSQKQPNVIFVSHPKVRNMSLFARYIHELYLNLQMYYFITGT